MSVNLTNDIKAFDIDDYLRQSNTKGWDRTFGTKGDFYKLTQLVGRGEFPDFISETVLEGMEEVLEVELIGKDLFQTFNNARPVISWLEEHGFDAQVLAEGEAPKNARLRHAKKTFRAIKLGLGLEFSREALRDIDRMDTLGRHLKRVGRAIAFKENQYLLAVALNGVADGSNRHLSGEIYDSHVLDGNNASWAISGSMDDEKIQVVQQIFQEEHFDLTTAIMSPATHTGMLGTERFAASNVIQYLSPDMQSVVDNKSNRPYWMPGGVEMLVNREMPNGEVLFLDKSEFGGYFEIEGITSVELPEDLARMKKMGFYKELGAVAMKPSAAVRITNINAKNPDDYV